MASYSGDMAVASTNGGLITVKIHAVPHIRRMEMPTENGIMVVIINTQTREVYSYGKDANGPMGIRAMKLKFDAAAMSMAADMSHEASPVLINHEIIAGQSCSNYTTSGGSACVTGDGILLQSLSNDGGGMKMTALERGPQADYLFRVPNGYQINDVSSLTAAAGGVSDDGVMTGNSGFQSFIENQAAKQTKKQIQKAARKQLGNTVGGAIGGGIVGGAVGEQAGKLAKGLVGGLFGKKKKKKKKKDDDKK